MKKIESKPDLLWKDLLTEFDTEFVLFFFEKKLHDSIDFTIKPEFLEQELNETFAVNEPNKKIADKIVRYRLKNGKYRFVIVHIEFQGQSEKGFVERMFRYFIYIYLKYGCKDISALALYTGASRPKVYDVFSISTFGTSVSYKFNTYTVRDQNEEVLLQSENPFAIAVLASLYLMKAGKDPLQKLAYKKKLIEIAIAKNFDRAKLYRLFNFVFYLVRLPKNLETEFIKFTTQPKIEKKMEFKKDFLETFAQNALIDIRKEEREKGREDFIMNIHDKMGFSAEQIANMTDFTVEYIQSVIDRCEVKRKK